MANTVESSMTSQSPPPEPTDFLEVHATPEQRRILVEAARREHCSVSTFMLDAALQAASAPSAQEEQRPGRTPEEIDSVFKELNRAFLAANPHNPDIVAELIAERRAEAARE